MLRPIIVRIPSGKLVATGYLIGIACILVGLLVAGVGVCAIFLHLVFSDESNVVLKASLVLALLIPVISGMRVSVPVLFQYLRLLRKSDRDLRIYFFGELGLQHPFLEGLKITLRQAPLTLLYVLVLLFVCFAFFIWIGFGVVVNSGRHMAEAEGAYNVLMAALFCVGAWCILIFLVLIFVRMSLLIILDVKSAPSGPNTKE